MGRTSPLAGRLPPPGCEIARVCSTRRSRGRIGAARPCARRNGRSRRTSWPRGGKGRWPRTRRTRGRTRARGDRPRASSRSACAPSCSVREIARNRMTYVAKMSLARSASSQGFPMNVSVSSLLLPSPPSSTGSIPGRSCFVSSKLLLAADSEVLCCSVVLPHCPPRTGHTQPVSVLVMRRSKPSWMLTYHAYIESLG